MIFLIDKINQELVIAVYESIADLTNRVEWQDVFEGESLIVDESGTVYEWDSSKKFTSFSSGQGKRKESLIIIMSHCTAQAAGAVRFRFNTSCGNLALLAPLLRSLRSNAHP